MELKKLVSEHLALYHEERMVKRWMKLNGSLFIDVGAGIGTYCINLSPCFREVWAFEPHPRNREKLLANLNLYQIKNVQVYPQAIGGRREVKTFYESTTNPLISGFIRGYTYKTMTKNAFPDNIGAGAQAFITGLLKSGPSICHHIVNLKTRVVGEVEVTTLSEVVGNRMVDFIKVDVEGFEKEVLKGANKIIRQVKLWQIEIHNTDNLPFFHREFSKLGFQIQKYAYRPGSDWDAIIASRGD